MDFDDPDDDPDNDLDLPSPKPPSSSSKPSSSSSSAPRYRECLKNHAVSIGGNAVDGCGEFMPAGDDGSMDALRCAACNCHRNFHRREYLPSTSSAAAGPTSSHFSPYYRTPAGYLHPILPPHRSPTGGTPHLGHHHLQPPLALPSTSAGGGAQSRGDDDELSAGGAQTGSGSRKRFRTKFTAEQKEKMLAFAERVGWRIQKHDEAAVQEFCNEAGVKRHVLKVWMHNNKHTLGKKP